MSKEIDDALDNMDKELDEVEPTEGAVEEGKQAVPGYIGYDEWIEQGKDPADFKGENAYKAEYERIREIRELKSTMQSVAIGVEDWKTQQTIQMNQQIEQARTDAQAELDQAKEAEDMTAALAAQEKINNLQPQQVPAQVNPAIKEFEVKNPIIDKNSARYDAAFFGDMSMFQGTIINELTGGNEQAAGQLTPEQITRTMELAYSKAKQMHPDKFTSPRNNRQSGPPSKQRGKQKPDYRTQLKAVGENKLNPQDDNAANDIYDMLKEKDPAAAETFAKNVLGVE